ncbi:hypothetical protein BDZ97DRAFT_300983 [Flammula alnicola]|nr:hypothetical protein BDZ97DRAFT_300983 [Flammula alnicola]
MKFSKPSINHSRKTNKQCLPSGIEGLEGKELLVLGAPGSFKIVERITYNLPAGQTPARPPVARLWINLPLLSEIWHGFNRRGKGPTIPISGAPLGHLCSESELVPGLEKNVELIERLRFGLWSKVETVVQLRCWTRRSTESNRRNFWPFRRTSESGIIKEIRNCQSFEFLE